ncbi:MAG: hypothetical protein GWN58_13720 [Anaerolineae bacterium]|nr:hypothetical protein [Anaerolineae bacterium]
MRRRRGEGLVGPFLADGFESPAERREAIADEVQWYLMAQEGMDLPPGIEPTEMPDCLVWLLRVERWGLPLPGGYLNQPEHFMRDLEAAAVGRMRVEGIKAANLRIQQQHARTQQE